jgi:hypothetical protein
MNIQKIKSIALSVLVVFVIATLVSVGMNILLHFTNMVVTSIVSLLAMGFCLVVIYKLDVNEEEVIKLDKA